MDRQQFGTVRNNWQQIITDQGLTYWPTTLPDNTTRSYWREGPHYVFSEAEIEQMYEDAKTLMEMFVTAGDYIVSRPDIMDKMHIPEWARDQIKQSWDRVDKDGNVIDWGSIYGRIDVRYGGSWLDSTGDQTWQRADSSFARIRLYEFNADTPTSLPESAIIQWLWHEQTKQGKDQWNSVFEDMVEAWKRNLQHVEDKLGHKPVVYFACTWEDNLLPELVELHPDHGSTDQLSDGCSYEDLQNLRIIEDACQKAGYETEWRYMQEIHLGEDGRFYDGRQPGLDKPHIDVIFKLWPWEFMVAEDFGQAAFEDMAKFGERAADGTYIGGTLWIEPPYKMMWSNKGLLPVLWKLFEHDPEKAQLLIPAWFEGEEPPGLQSYIRKPLLSREGASIEVVDDGKKVLVTNGDYGEEGYIIQEYCPPPLFPGLTPRNADEDNHPVLGIWYVDGEPAGLSIRESEGVVTDNLSYFAPHTIRP